jgi:hypothetical protein
VLESLARLPVSEREAILASLSDKQAEQAACQAKQLKRSLETAFLHDFHYESAYPSIAD